MQMVPTCRWPALLPRFSVCVLCSPSFFVYFAKQRAVRMIVAYTIREILHNTFGLNVFSMRYIYVYVCIEKKGGRVIQEKECYEL